MTKKDLKDKQARGEHLELDQIRIIYNDYYGDDYELTPYEAMSEQEQEDKVIADIQKSGDARESSRGYSTY